MSIEVIKNKMIVCYFIGSIFIFSFVALSNGAGYFASADLRVFHINGKPVIIHFVFTLIFLIGLLIVSVNKIKFTTLHLVLLFFTLVPLISHSYKGEFSSFTTYYIAVIIMAISFFIGSQYSGKLEYITKCIMIFGCVLSIQVILAAVVSEISYSDLNYKYFMRIPIAASNVIAAFLNPCFFLIMKNYKGNKIIKLFILLLIALAVVLTKSRGGVLILLFSLIWIIYKRKTKYKSVKRLFLLFSLTAFSALALNTIMIEQFLFGYSSAYGDSGNILNSLSSGRLNLYSEELGRWMNHFFIGNGMTYEETYTGSHNLILSILTQFGLIGFLFYVYALSAVLVPSLLHMKNRTEEVGITFFLCIFLLHGMIELNFFNYTGDMIFWFLAGVLIRARTEEETKQVY